MSRFDALTIMRKELAVSKHIPITHLNSPSVFETNTGMLGMVIKLQGVAFDTEQDDVLNAHKYTWHRALAALDERYCIYETMHRRKANTLLSGEFNSQFEQQLDGQYHQQFKNSSMYINDLYLTVLYKGITTGKVAKGFNLLQGVAKKTIKQAREHLRSERLKQLQSTVQQLMATLSEFNPRLLGKRDGELGYGELLSFLSLIVNGGKICCLASTSYANPIASSIAECKKLFSLYPAGDISQYLPQKRLFFGDNIQFQGNMKDDKTFAAIVSVKRYASDTTAIMLDSLLQVDCEYIRTNSFAIEAKDLAQDRIKRQIIKKQNVNDPAVTQIDALHQARDLLASDQLCMGYHHNTIMLLASTQAELEEKLTEVIKCFTDAGFVAIKETIGQEPAFWAQIPGNMQHIARASMITSENFVDFVPLHNYHNGYQDANHLGSAVTLLQTPSKTPYYFNYHVKGSVDNPSKGHALIIGGNNSGKTVLMSFLDGQMSRYGGSTYYFDRDRGAEIYIRACGGYYTVLSPENPQSTQFNPLLLPDNKDNRNFNFELLQQLCKNEAEVALPTELVELLRRCVDYAYDKLATEHRTLSNATKILPINFQRWPNLRQWLYGNGKHSDGCYAYIFDNQHDKLMLHNKVGFDMTHFLDREPNHIRTALLMYLFHRINLSLTGNRVSILLDEGWQYFIDPYWKNALQKWLPTLRKRNGHIVIATQSPSSVINSPVRSMMLDNIATLILFANPQAKRDEYINGFNLTKSEFETIANNPPASRLFLVKQDHDSVLCKLNLADLPDLLAVLSGNAVTVRLLKSIIDEFGDAPDKWLPVFQKRRLELSKQ